MEKVIAPENLKSTNVIKSPCGQYEVQVQNYQIGTGWSYSRIILSKANAVLLSVDRNYGFRGGFFERQGQSWFWTGKHYQSQIMINLETLEQYESKEKIESHTFCWAEAKASASGLILAVEGCVWGGPYEIRFYDLSYPDRGWPRIEVERKDDFELLCDEADWEWKGETFHYRNWVPWDPKLNKLAWLRTCEEIQSSNVEDEDQDLDLYEVELELQGTMKFKSFFLNQQTKALLE